MPERANDTVDYVVRFSLWARFQHAMIILLFGPLLPALRKRREKVALDVTD